MYQRAGNFTITIIDFRFEMSPRVGLIIPTTSIATGSVTGFIVEVALRIPVTATEL